MKALLNIEGLSPQAVEAIEKAIVSILNTHGNTWGELWLKRHALRALKETCSVGAPTVSMTGCNFQGSGK